MAGEHGGAVRGNKRQDWRSQRFLLQTISSAKSTIPSCSKPTLGGPHVNNGAGSSQCRSSWPSSSSADHSTRPRWMFDVGKRPNVMMRGGKRPVRGHTTRHGTLVYERSTASVARQPDVVKRKEEQALMHELKSQLLVQRRKDERNTLSLSPQQADSLRKLTHEKEFHPPRRTDNMLVVPRALLVDRPLSCHFQSNGSPVYTPTDSRHCSPKYKPALQRTLSNKSPSKSPPQQSDGIGGRAPTRRSSPVASSSPSLMTADSPKTGYSVERWFASKFVASGERSAYDGFCEEFETIQKQTDGSWSSDCSRGPTLLRPSKAPNGRKPPNKVFAVNAHTIDGCYGRKYIACEGPNYGSVYDFWEMVWQENVKAIVSVNWPFEERSYPRSYDYHRETIQYWPLKVGEERKFMPWKISCQWTKLKIRSNELAAGEDYVYRVSSLRLTESNPVSEPEPRHILHICHYRWPDGQIPRTWGDKVATHADAAAVVCDILRRELSSVRSPIVVHCHAGVGRTGVLVALDIALERLLAKRVAEVNETVRRVREQRPRAVMNQWQYAFINVALAQFALSKGMLPSTIHDGKQQVASVDLIAECWTNLVAHMRLAVGHCERDDKDVVAAIRG